MLFTMIEYIEIKEVVIGSADITARFLILVGSPMTPRLIVVIGLESRRNI